MLGQFWIKDWPSELRFWHTSPISTDYWLQRSCGIQINNSRKSCFLIGQTSNCYYFMVTGFCCRKGSVRGNILGMGLSLYLTNFLSADGVIFVADISIFYFRSSGWYLWKLKIPEDSSTTNFGLPETKMTKRKDANPILILTSPQNASCCYSWIVADVTFHNALSWDGL